MDRLEAELQRLTMAEASREVMERLIAALPTLPEDEAAGRCRAFVAEHWADAPDERRAGIYDALVDYARLARGGGTFGD